MTVEQQLSVIKRGVVDIYTEDELVQKLKKSLKTKKPLRVKLGVDPTSSDIHLGHTVVLRKLRQFQDLGHIAVLIIGDYTALVGDPSGRDKTRPQLDSHAIEENASTYLDQVKKILDMDRVEIVRNGDWLSKLTFKEVLDLTSKMTVARLLERDDFLNRYQNGIPIGMHEFMYPLMQGYDSIVVNADVELGGTDQTFNLMVGRNLQRDSGQEAQVALTVPILVGTDGTQKMSKSLGNYIGVTDAPNDMFGKVMSIADNLLDNYFELLTDVPEAEFKALIAEHPMKAKKALAFSIVSQYYGADDAENAQKEFERVFSNKDLPEDIPDVVIPAVEIDAGKIWIVKLVSIAEFASSNSEARRLVKQGGVSIDDEKITDAAEEVVVKDGQILKVGRRRFARLRIE